MSVSETIESAVDLLLTARRERRRMIALPEALRPADMSCGYNMQDRLVERIGDEVLGWKLGVGSAKLKRQSGLGRSIAGRILKSRLFGPEARVGLTFVAPVTIEFEVAFLLCADVSPGDSIEARGKITEARIAFELVQSSFVDRRAAGWPSFTADNSGFEALILGDLIDAADIPRLLDSLVVSVDGAAKAGAATGEDATDPWQAFDDLVALARERRIVLTKGSLISTGSASLPFAVAQASGDVVAAYLGKTLRFRFEAPAQTLRSQT